MLKNESFFRLCSIGLLGVLFISVTAIAAKEKKETPQTIFSSVRDIEEAERINNGDLQVMNLTSIGERVEIIMPPNTQK